MGLVVAKVPPQRPRYAQAYYRQRLLQPFSQARSRVGIDPHQPVGRLLRVVTIIDSALIKIIGG